MIARYAHLHTFPRVFLSLTGLRWAEFAALADTVRLPYAAREAARLARPTRHRAAGGGHPVSLDARDQLLLTLVWLRQYPTQEVLGFLFGVSDSTVSRITTRLLPVLADAGQATMHMPDPGRKHRRQFDELVRDLPELFVVIDSFEQRVQRPENRAEADAWYSGKKKMHTIKSQVVINGHTGEICDIAESVPGPTADITLLEDSHILDRLPDGVGAEGDLAYVGIAKLHPQGLGATPRRKPRGQDRPPEDVAYNTAFSRRRITVEHTIGRMRRYQAITQPDRQHRHGHTERVRAISGLANRQFQQRQLALAA